MKAMEHAHIVQPDEVMAYLDGELEPRRASAVGAHIGACKACQTVADDMRRVSRSLMHWHVGEAPTGRAAPAGAVVVGGAPIADLLGRSSAGISRWPRPRPCSSWWVGCG